MSDDKRLAQLLRVIGTDNPRALRAAVELIDATCERRIDPARTELLAIADAMLDSCATYHDPIGIANLVRAITTLDGCHEDALGHCPADDIRQVLAAVIDIAPDRVLAGIRAAWSRELDDHLELRAES